MKFAHLADAHIGCWRDPKLKDLSIQAFEKAIDSAIKRKVDFILFAGDLFNSAIPPINYIKETVRILKKIKQKEIPFYIIAGSHDYSPSGKSMLDVLEETGLVINVVKGEVEENKLKLKFTKDKTGVKITGMLGKAGQLDKKIYQVIDHEALESEKGFKIFMFHTALSEMKPEHLQKMDSEPVSILPKGFDYYAGGHVHIADRYTFDDHKNIIYPGPVFPVNFSELEKLGKGGYYIYDDKKKLEFVPIELKKVVKLNVDANNKQPNKVYEEIIDFIDNEDLRDSILLIRVHGKLKSGKSSDINFREIISHAYDHYAYFVMRNTSKLEYEHIESIKIDVDNAENVENKLLEEQSGKVRVSFSKEEIKIAKDLIAALSVEQVETEKKYDYEERLKTLSENVFN